MTAAPRLFTIPAHEPFALTLARTLLDQYGDDFVALSRVRIMTPNRRSCRTLAEAFLAARDGKPCLLPHMMPIGDVAEDDLALGDIFNDPNSDIPPAIAPLERQLLLGQLLHQQQPHVPPAQILSLASQLATLIDAVHTENLDWTHIHNLVPDELAHHWQRTVDFLAILFEYWPKILQDRGLIDPADRRNRLLRRYADTLRNERDPSPIIAAGSTGSVPATRDILRTVAHLSHGSVIVSGLDQSMPETAWDLLPDTHPQFYLKTLLDHIGIARPDVKTWHDAQTTPPLRTMVLQQCVATPDTPAPQQPLPPQAVTGLSLVRATQPQQEAKIVALKIREALEHPTQSILVVTPDRTLAQRIEAELGRWDIRVNDSAGIPYMQTRPGTWLAVTASLMMPDQQAVALLSVLHHPLCGTDAFAVRLFERYILRGPRWHGGLSAIATATQDRLPQRHTEHHDSLLQLGNQLQSVLAPAYETAERSLTDWLVVHITLAETLAKDDSLWSGEQGEIGAEILQDLHQYAHLYPATMDAAQYHDFITRYMGQSTFRPRYPLHPRINILGPIEARLQQADLMILAGMNETIWPREAPHDPFMSQPMRNNFGLSPFNRRIGQAGFDFYLLAHAPHVFITTSQMRDGAMIAPSRWLQQMDVVLRRDHIALPVDRDWASIADTMDRPDMIRSHDRPSFAPPVSSRPRSASVSDLDVWRRDPYAFYAKKVLHLRDLDPPENEAAARDWGNVVHNLLELYAGQTPFPRAQWDATSEQVLNQLALPMDIHLQWRQRLSAIGAWMSENTVTTGDVSLEKDGIYTFADVDFTVNGRADMIDNTNGHVVVSDYKTGSASRSEPQMLSGYAPQLPFLGLMAEQGGFKGIAPSRVSALQYIALGGQTENPVTVRKFDKNVSTILERNRDSYARLITEFDKPDTAYITRPHPKYIHNPFNPYGHLERVQEWSGNEDGEDAS